MSYLKAGEGDHSLAVALHKGCKEELKAASLLGLQGQGDGADQLVRAIGQVKGQGVPEGVLDGHLQGYSLPDSC